MMFLLRRLQAMADRYPLPGPSVNDLYPRGNVHACAQRYPAVRAFPSSFIEYSTTSLVNSLPLIPFRGVFLICDIIIHGGVGIDGECRMAKLRLLGQHHWKIPQEAVHSRSIDAPRLIEAFYAIRSLTLPSLDSCACPTTLYKLVGPKLKAKYRNDRVGSRILYCLFLLSILIVCIRSLT